MAPSEGGKTTTAMALCQKYEYRFKANDASVIKKIGVSPVMLRGDCVINARLNGLELYSKKISNDVDTGKKGNVNPWNQKYNIDPRELGIQTDYEEREVNFIFFVKLDVMMDEVRITKYEGAGRDKNKNWFKHKMEVYQNIGGTIGGTDAIPYINNGKIAPMIIPSLDRKELKRRRIKFINDIFESCEIYEIRGKLEEVTDAVDKIMRS